ncbi:MAG: VOC family protein [Pseudomonadota bacterium]
MAARGGPHAVNRFVWADLSTFDLASAKAFYTDTLGWSYHGADDGYEVCVAGQTATAGLYVMPEAFQQINMPSFWMSYVQVADLDRTVAAAEAHGARIEVAPTPGPGNSRIALVRDPAGAGFTCLEGELGTPPHAGQGPGRVVWHELHVSDLTRVQPFYEAVFGWRVTPAAGAPAAGAPASGTDRYALVDAASNGAAVAGIQVTPNAIKGDKEYWGVYVAVDSLDSTAAAVDEAGGEVLAVQPLGDRDALLIADPQGAALYLVEDDTPGRDIAGRTRATGAVKWRATAGLFVVAAAVLLEANWLWGVLFLLWVVPDLKSGVTHFLERVDRREHPALFWTITLTWLGLSVYLLVEPWVSG